MEKIYRRKGTMLFAGILALTGLLFVLFWLVYGLVTGELWIFFVFLTFVGILELVFVLIFFSEKRSILRMDDESITFHYHVFSQDRGYRGLNRRGLRIAYADVESVECNYHQGDGIISGNSYQVEFLLKNGVRFTCFFYHFGKAAEREIVHTLQTRFGRG